MRALALLVSLHVEMPPSVASRSLVEVVAWEDEEDRILPREGLLVWKESLRKVLYLVTLHLVVLQDAPLHARKAMMTRRELRVEAQHVVEEHSVDVYSMDAGVAYGKDVEMGAADTCKAEDRLIRWGHLEEEGAAPGKEDKEEGSRWHLVEDIDGGVRMVEVAHGARL